MTMRSRVLAIALALMLHAGMAPAQDAEAQLDARVHALSAQLRCLVCQNQTLADSNADLAVDLRRQIREQLRAGASDQAVKDYLAQRYGDFVLYRPPVRPLTWLLWFGPALLLATVVAAIVRARRERRATGDTLDDNEQARLAALLDDASRPHTPEPPRP